MTTLALFNVFGLVRLEKTHVFALGTGILENGRSIEKSFSEDLPEPIQEIEDGATEIILFAAYLDAAGKAKIATQNLSARAGAVNLSGHPEVKRALKEVVHEIKIVIKSATLN
jgi:hypothetical protein